MIPWQDREKICEKYWSCFWTKKSVVWDIPAEDTFDLLRVFTKLTQNEYQKTKKELVELLNLEKIIKYQ